jgi:hypothetical protein
MRALIVLLLASLFTPAMAASPKFSAVYNVMRAGQIIGEAKETLEISRNQYHLESTLTPVGVVAIFVKETFKQISSGEIDKSGFHPQQYAYQRSVNSDKNIDASFDWKTKTATFKFDGKSESHPLPPLLQDRLSLFYQFKYWPKSQTTLRLPMSNGKGITEYTIVRSGEETLTLPAGTFRTTRYVRARTPDDDGITVWVSDKLAAPVKILIEGKKGEQTEQVLTHVTSE